MANGLAKEGAPKRNVAPHIVDFDDHQSGPIGELGRSAQGMIPTPCPAVRTLLTDDVGRTTHVLMTPMYHASTSVTYPSMMTLLAVSRYQCRCFCVNLRVPTLRNGLHFAMYSTNGGFEGSPSNCNACSLSSMIPPCLSSQGAE